MEDIQAPALKMFERLELLDLQPRIPKADLKRQVKGLEKDIERLTERENQLKAELEKQSMQLEKLSMELERNARALDQQAKDSEAETILLQEVLEESKERRVKYEALEKALIVRQLAYSLQSKVARYVLAEGATMMPFALTLDRTVAKVKTPEQKAKLDFVESLLMKHGLGPIVESQDLIQGLCECVSGCSTFYGNSSEVEKKDISASELRDVVNTSQVDERIKVCAAAVISVLSELSPKLGPDESLLKY